MRLIWITLKISNEGIGLVKYKIRMVVGWLSLHEEAYAEWSSS